MERVEDADFRDLPPGLTVVEKDLPVLAAAVSAHADFLLTGDKNHFGHLYEARINATTVLAPGTFLHQQAERIKL
jgi:predicted nucleic acid-binding protein